MQTNKNCQTQQSSFSLLIKILCRMKISGYDFDINKKSMFSNYKLWHDQKQKGSATVKILERQNQKLMRQNIALRKQNQQLLKFKQKYLNNMESPQEITQQTLKINTLGLNSNRKSLQNKNQYRYQSNQKSYYPAQSARNYSQISTRIQNHIFQTQNKLNSRRSSMSKGKRRFNYLGEIQSLSTKIEQPQKPKQQLDAKKYFQHVQLKESKQCDLKVQFQSNKKQVHESPLKYVQQLSNQKQNKYSKLQQEIQQLRDIQSKLLDKIQKRDTIIENLLYLLTVQKNKSYSQKKQTDRQTIDSAFSPKIYP